MTKFAAFFKGQVEKDQGSLQQGRGGAELRPADFRPKWLSMAGEPNPPPTKSSRSIPASCPWEPDRPFNGHSGSLNIEHTQRKEPHL